MWSVGIGKMAKELTTDLAVMSMAYSPDGKTLAAGVLNERVQMWDTVTWKETPGVKGHRTQVMSVAYTRDGKTVASTGGVELKLWDAGTGKLRLTFKQENFIRAMAFSPDGKLVASGDGAPKAGASGEVVIWDASSGEERQRWEVRDGGVVALAIAADGKTLATRSYGGAVEITKVKE